MVVQAKNSRANKLHVRAACSSATSEGGRVLPLPTATPATRDSSTRSVTLSRFPVQEVEDQGSQMTTEFRRRRSDRASTRVRSTSVQVNLICHRSTTIRRRLDCLAVTKGPTKDFLKDTIWLTGMRRDDPRSQTRQRQILQLQHLPL